MEVNNTIRINLNSPDGNIFVILNKVTTELYNYYSKEEVEKWIKSVLYKRNYDQIIDKIQEDWCLWDKASNLEFYKSEKYEMEKENLCI